MSLCSDPLLFVIQEMLTTWHKTPVNLSIGSVKAAHQYIMSLEEILKGTETHTLSYNEAVDQVLQAKLQLNATCKYRALNQALVKALLATEELTHMMIDYLMSHPDFKDETPRPDFRFNWAPMLNDPHGPAIYLTHYGTEDRIKHLVGL
jgi:hypothetical protein